jgi:GGDEF domain-containing protein
VLEPLHAHGAEFFWLWPVFSQESMAAVLAVGYRGVPQVAAEIAGFGTECASRIGVALSNSARGEQLYRQAHFDALTGLPNRLLFRDRLSQELASAADGLQRGALLYVDLDHFRDQRHGRPQQRSCCRSWPSACAPASGRRHGGPAGGDEFTVILRGVGTADSAQRITAQVMRCSGSREYRWSRPLRARQHRHHAVPGRRLALDELMRNADLAMYRARPTVVPGPCSTTAPCSACRRWRPERPSQRPAAARVFTLLPPPVRAQRRLSDSGPVAGSRR